MERRRGKSCGGGDRAGSGRGELHLHFQAQGAVFFSPGESVFFICSQDLVDGIQYKVNITALVEDSRVGDPKGQESARMSVESLGFAESKALHEKVS